MEQKSAFLQKLKDEGYSLTQPRNAIYEALAESDAVTMAQLTKLVSKAADRTSVYRTVELFEKLGIVNRIQIGWKYKLELSHEFSHHHHHASCTQCGKVVMFEEHDDLESGIHALADSLGFRLSGHTLEIRGMCPQCANK